ncbi:MAG: dienelactone hydrolase family protein, partial [Pirellula sp.]
MRFFNLVNVRSGFLLGVVLAGAGSVCGEQESAAQTLSGTEKLVARDDIASDLVSGVDEFLLRQIAASSGQRETNWLKGLETSTAEKYLSDQRKRLTTQLGMIDKRIEGGAFQILAPFSAKSTVNGVADGLIVSTDSCAAYQVHWPVFQDVDATGIIVAPKNRGTIRFCCVLIPDASQMPEQLCGIGEGGNDLALRIANQGGLVVVPQVVSRNREARNGRAIMTDQEFIYRSAFVLGRHLLGYMVHETVAAVDIFRRDYPTLPVLVAGWGEGGWIALHAGAVDPRIDVTCVSGHFGPRENVWNEPIHRNVQSLLSHFGDAQLAALIAPRHLVIDAIPGPQVEVAGEGGAPGKLSGPSTDAVMQEVEIAKRLLAKRQSADRIHVVVPSSALSGASGNPVASGLPGSRVPTQDSIKKCMQLLGIENKNSELQSSTTSLASQLVSRAKERNQETVRKWDLFQQRILESAATERQWFWDSLKGATKETYEQRIESAREIFRNETIGDWNLELTSPMPRTRLVYETPTWTGYDVVLDVFDEVIAYGTLLIPKDGRPVENRPCVVFQHGLEGRPKDTIEGNHPAYHDVSAKLAEQGYVVFAPQNLYLFKDRFRSLQRKSNPLGRTLFSIMVPQHQQIVRWLATRPEVDAKRIGFYGLSYGGKSAMRIPALVKEYCLSICSADFNEWVWKNA